MAEIFNIDMPVQDSSSEVMANLNQAPIWVPSTTPEDVPARQPAAPVRGHTRRMIPLPPRVAQAQIAGRIPRSQPTPIPGAVDRLVTARYAFGTSAEPSPLLSSGPPQSPPPLASRVLGNIHGSSYRDAPVFEDWGFSPPPPRPADVLPPPRPASIWKVELTEREKQMAVVPAWFPVFDAMNVLMLCSEGEQNRCVEFQTILAYLEEHVDKARFAETMDLFPPKQWALKLHLPSPGWEHPVARRQGG